MLHCFVTVLYLGEDVKNNTLFKQTALILSQKRMKKVVVVILMLATGKLYGQQGFHIGVNVGLNTVWITHQDDYGQTGILHVLDYGVAPALTAGYNFNNAIGLQLDFIYSFQGGKYQQTLKSETYDRVVNLSYFKIPVYFKYDYTPTGIKNVKFFIMAGPQISILQSAAIISNYLTSPYTGNNENYRFEAVNFELAGEAGADIYVNSKLYFNLGFRLDYGLTDMNAPTYRIPSNGSPYEAGANATGGIILGVNYLFAKKAVKPK